MLMLLCISRCRDSGIIIVMSHSKHGVIDYLNAGGDFIAFSNRTLRAACEPTRYNGVAKGL